MDVVDTFNLIKRRRSVVIPVLVLTLALAVYAVAVLPPGYIATGSILVKDAIGESSPISPALFAESLQDQQTRSEVATAGATGNYAVSSEGDLVLVKSTGVTAADAVATANAVLDSMAGRLEQLETEAEVEPDLRSTVNVVNAPETAIRTDVGFEASGSAQVEEANASATPVGAETMRDALVQILSSEDVARTVAEEGGNADYEFGFQKGSPILEISASGTDDESTVKTVGLLIDQAAEQSELLASELGDQKASDPLIQDLVVPTAASVDRKGPLRSVAAIGVVGVGLAVSLAVAIEAYAEWRRRNTLERLLQASAGADGPETAPEDDVDEDQAASAVGPQGWRRVEARSSQKGG
ncbi:MAG: hypothetical protein ACK5O2_05685 [Microthrixaceae bacterium]